MTMSDLYMRTLDKKMYLQENGYKYICKWECDFKRESEESTELKTFVKTLEFVKPLEPREAFYGGRTEGFQLYAEASTSKKIKYYDVTSLYPFINKTGKIPRNNN